MTRSNRRRLFSLFAFALLAFAIYLIVFSKEEEPASTSKNTAKVATAPHH